MRATLILFLLLWVGALACQAPTALGENGEAIFRQSAIGDIACGPSALFNWLSHGDEDLQAILTTLSADKTPVQVVEHIIDTYGKRRSSTSPAVTRYGRHNGGERVPRDHPLRPLRAVVDRALEELSPRFTELYSPVGRPSIAPEKLLRAARGVPSPSSSYKSQVHSVRCQGCSRNVGHASRRSNARSTQKAPRIMRRACVTGH